MKVRLLLSAAAMAAAVVPLLGATAHATPPQMAAGTGHTNEGNTWGFNAKQDLKGDFNYVSHDGVFHVKCHGYTSFKEKLSYDGYPAAVFFGICEDQNGTTIYMETYAIDRGEPGLNDSARIYFTYNQAQFHDIDNYAGQPGVYSDTGQIDHGNIQVLGFS
jgi:hypothetical protein